MIEQFNKTAISNFFDYNDPDIHRWAENVYEKLRQNGELADYVKRDKIVRAKHDVLDQSIKAPIMVKDNQFTFGYAYTGTKLGVVNDQVADLGVVYQVEFELMIDNVTRNYDISMFSGNLLILRTNQVKLNGDHIGTLNITAGKITYLKLIRDHSFVKLYQDNELIQETNIQYDNSTQYSVLYEIVDAPESLFQVNFGQLYNWLAIDDPRNICSDGYHIIEYEEHEALLQFLGIRPDALIPAGVLREPNPLYWDILTGSTNEFSFNARGSGLRDHVDGSFELFKQWHEMWVSSKQGDYLGYGQRIESDSDFVSGDDLYCKVEGYEFYGNNGASVRIVADNTLLSEGQSGVYVGNDGKRYRTICIGGIEILADNLCETKYRDGSEIPEVTDNTDWIEGKVGMRCFYNNDPNNE